MKNLRADAATISGLLAAARHGLTVPELRAASDLGDGRIRLALAFLDGAGLVSSGREPGRGRWAGTSCPAEVWRARAPTPDGLSVRLSRDDAWLAAHVLSWAVEHGHSGEPTAGLVGRLREKIAAADVALAAAE